MGMQFSHASTYQSKTYFLSVRHASTDMCGVKALPYWFPFPGDAQVNVEGNDSKQERVFEVRFRLFISPINLARHSIGIARRQSTVFAAHDADTCDGDARSTGSGTWGTCGHDPRRVHPTQAENEVLHLLLLLFHPWALHGTPAASPI
eukprot:1984072-Pyramimonas_sp.AAC.5